MTATSMHRDCARTRVLPSTPTGRLRTAVRGPRAVGDTALARRSIRSDGLDRNTSDAADLAASAGVGADPREIESTIETCWPSIKAIARDLFIAGRLDHDDVAHHLGLDGTDNDAAVVASIRAGMLPIPAWLPS